jgi:hypothetical protein
MNAGFGSWLFRMSLGASALGELADGRWSEWRGLQKRILRLARLRLRGPRRGLLAATAQNPMQTYTPYLLRECRDAALLKVGLSMPEYPPKLD